MEHTMLLYQTVINMVSKQQEGFWQWKLSTCIRQEEGLLTAELKERADFSNDLRSNVSVHIAKRISAVWQVGWLHKKDDLRDESMCKAWSLKDRTVSEAWVKDWSEQQAKVQHRATNQKKMKIAKLKEKIISEFLPGIFLNVGTVMKEVMSKVNHI